MEGDYKWITKRKELYTKVKSLKSKEILISCVFKGKMVYCRA